MATDTTSGWVSHNKSDKIAADRHYKFCSCLLAQEFSSGKSRSLLSPAGIPSMVQEVASRASGLRCAVRPSIGPMGTAPNPRGANSTIGKLTWAEL